MPRPVPDPLPSGRGVATRGRGGEVVGSWSLFACAERCCARGLSGCRVAGCACAASCAPSLPSVETNVEQPVAVRHWAAHASSSAVHSMEVRESLCLVCTMRGWGGGAADGGRVGGGGLGKQAPCTLLGRLDLAIAQLVGLVTADRLLYVGEAGAIDAMICRGGEDCG